MEWNSILKRNGNGSPEQNGNGHGISYRSGNGHPPEESLENRARSTAPGGEQGPLVIAQVAPLYESVPPVGYGGTERVVSYLTEQLVAEGHDVTLFAAGDSRTSARLVAASQRSLRLDDRCRDPLVHHILLLERVLAEAHRFDVIHFHCDYIHFPSSRRLPVPAVTTLHGRLDHPDLVPLYREFADTPLVSISDAQRAPLPWAGWKATIHHGLPASYGGATLKSRGYLAFVGRVSPEKRLDLAIEIARRSGKNLRVAAKVDANDRDYFDDVIRPLLDEPGVEFLGEIGEEEKMKLLGESDALVFPIDWPEPFGLVMIEALACGIPVIAFRRGSVPEVIQDGVTGYVVNNVDEAVGAVARIGDLSRSACRAAFEQRFTAERMASDYVATYRSLLGSLARERAKRDARFLQTVAE
jgi:glycosyltransferase involved in cell wall biosynthesis